MTAEETMAMALAEGIEIRENGRGVQYGKGASPELVAAIGANIPGLLHLLTGGRGRGDPLQRTMPLLQTVGAAPTNGHRPSRDGPGPAEQHNGHRPAVPDPDKLTLEELACTFRTPNVLRLALLNTSTGLSGAELRVYMYLVGHTLGYHKRSDMISLKQIRDGVRRKDGTVVDTGTGLNIRNVRRALDALIARKLIVREHRDDEPHGHLASLFSVRILNEEED